MPKGSNPMSDGEVNDAEKIKPRVQKISDLRRHASSFETKIACFQDKKCREGFH